MGTFLFCFHKLKLIILALKDCYFFMTPSKKLAIMHYFLQAVVGSRRWLAALPWVSLTTYTPLISAPLLKLTMFFGFCHYYRDPRHECVLVFWYYVLSTSLSIEACSV